MSIASVVLRGFKDSIAAVVMRGYRSLRSVAPVITTTVVPGAGQNVGYLVTLQATGDVTITWAVTVGALPTGLSLSVDGVISGAPTTVESQTFTVTATNASGSDDQAYTLAVAVVASGSAAARDGYRSGTVGRGLLGLRGRG